MTALEFGEMGQAITTDFLSLICGRFIDRGAGRQVYENNCDPTTVLKIEVSAKTFQNVLEWDLWDDFRDTKMEKWLAPCVDISPCGHVLIQKKTTPVKEFPRSIPNIFTDTKKSNFGMYEGRFVAHDYGYHACNYLISEGKTAMTKVNW